MLVLVWLFRFTGCARGGGAPHQWPYEYACLCDGLPACLQLLLSNPLRTCKWLLLTPHTRVVASAGSARFVEYEKYWADGEKYTQPCFKRASLGCFRALLNKVAGDNGIDYVSTPGLGFGSSGSGGYLFFMVSTCIAACEHWCTCFASVPIQPARRFFWTCGMPASASLMIMRYEVCFLGSFLTCRCWLIPVQAMVA